MICDQSWESPTARAQDPPPRQTSGGIVQQTDLVRRASEEPGVITLTSTERLDPA